MNFNSRGRSATRLSDPLCNGNRTEPSLPVNGVPGWIRGVMAIIGKARTIAARSSVAVMLGVVAAGVVGCTRQLSGVADAAAPRQTQPASPSSSARPSVTTVRDGDRDGKPAGGDPTTCRLPDLRVTLARAGVAAGHRYYGIRFTNSGRFQCTIVAWPGVSLCRGTEGAGCGRPRCTAGWSRQTHHAAARRNRLRQA